MSLKYLIYFQSRKKSELENEKLGRNRRRTSFCSLIQPKSCSDYPSCPYNHEGVHYRHGTKQSTSVIKYLHFSQDITFKILGHTNKLSVLDQRATFIKAFKIWEAASQLNIRETGDDKADILINFKEGYHGDGYPFDGQGGTLAHAFYPHDNQGISGDAHFDSEEPWTLRRRDGVNLEWVSIHEFGHSLGLGHSRIKGTIMYPWYQGYTENITLNVDDIRGIQRLYGKLRVRFLRHKVY